MAWTQAYENHIVNSSLAPYPFPHITGLELKGDIVINGLTLNTIDANDVLWVCTDIKGWWENPDVDSPDIQREYSDGSYFVRGRYQARQLTLEGSILATNRSKIPAARNTLVSAIDLVDETGWLIAGTTQKLASRVRLAGRPQIETVNTRGRTNFSIGLIAPDPVKYSWNPSDPLGEGYTLTSVPYANSTTSITNSGNYNSRCYFEITGPTTAPVYIQNATTGQTLLVSSNLTSGQTLQIDTYERSVAINGDPTGARAKLDVLVDWIYLQPGANAIKFFGTSAAPANLKVYHRSGWIA